MFSHIFMQHSVYPRQTGKRIDGPNSKSGKNSEQSNQESRKGRRGRRNSGWTFASDQVHFISL